MALVTSEGRSSWGKSFANSSSKSDPGSELEGWAFGGDDGLPGLSSSSSSPESCRDFSALFLGGLFVPPSTTVSPTFSFSEAGEYGFIGVNNI